MEDVFFYLANGKLFLHDGKGETEVHSGVADDYREKVRAQAKRSEWKHSGEGARFTGTYDPDAAAENRLAAIRSEISSAQLYEGSLYYALSLGGPAGIYRKRLGEGTDDGIVLSSADESYRTFCIRNEKIAAESAFAGETHIGIGTLGRSDFVMLTEGHTRDTDPFIDPQDDEVILFSSAGLSDEEKQPEEPAFGENPLPKILLSARRQSSARLGPSSVCSVHTKTGTLTELIGDDSFDYLHPRKTSDGTLYYIRRPYQTQNEKPPAGGCLLDLLLLPFRLLSALFGFFNLFSMKYSGKPLSRTPGEVRQKDEKKIIVEGNLIDAEKALRENTAKGDKNPGFVPRSWELHRKTSSGDEIIRRGVSAYCAEEDNSVLCYNGKSVLRIAPDGTETKIAEISGITAIL